jgi:outer membrane protein OmpA-like peptidoglycan-associated protein
VDTATGIAEGTDMKDRVFNSGRVLLFLSGALVGLAPAWAQDSPAVRELLDRAQSKSQTEAVENLIRKLKGGDSRPSVPSAKPAEPNAPAAVKVDAEPEPSRSSPPRSVASKPEPPTQAGPEPPLVAISPPQPEPATQPPAAASLADSDPPKHSVATRTEQQLAPPAPVEAPPTAAPPVAAEVAGPLPSVDLEVHFDYKSAAITSRAVDLLTTLGQALADTRLVGQTFLIAGHTDARGGDAFNMKLSLARAEAVRAFLIRHFSIAPERLRTEGRGLRQLKNAQNPYAGENRRVQVTNLTPQTARP